MPNINGKLHDVLSRHLRDYPKLWSPKRGPQLGQCEELAEKVTREMKEEVSAKKIRSTLTAIRFRLLQLEKGVATSMKTRAYLWYAQELGYSRAVEVIRAASAQEEPGSLASPGTVPTPSTSAGETRKRRSRPWLYRERGHIQRK
ncbi:uncharacterized protein ACN2A1_010285 [Glossina fuscipes fuscipes]